MPMSSRVSPPFFLVVTVIALLLASCGGEDSSPETSPVSVTTTTAIEPDPTTAPTTVETPSTTIDPAQSLAENLARIGAMVAARNTGDFEAWRAFFPAERPVIWASVIEDESQLEWQRSYMAANEVWTITDTCHLLPGNGVSCPMTLVNDFLGPAGIFYTAEVYFYVDGDGLISSFGANDWVIASDPGDYGLAFDDWLREAHPDVHASFDGPPDLPSAEDMPTALDYVAEFIEQSEEYPVG